MSRSRTFTTTTLLCGALAVSLVAAGCKTNRTARDTAATRAGDTTSSYGGRTPSDTLNATGTVATRTDTSRSFGGATPSTSRSLTGSTATTTRRRTSAQRRMTAAERQLYDQGKWDSTRLQQDTAGLSNQPKTEQNQLSLNQQNQLNQSPTTPAQRDTMPVSTQQDTLSPDTTRPAPDTALPDTTRRDTTSQLPAQVHANMLPAQSDTAKPNDVTAVGDSAKNIEGITVVGGGEPTDAQIVGIAITVNTADSSAGALAQTRSQNTQVREFARMMVQDHGASNQRIDELVRRLNVRPDSSWDATRDLLDDTRDATRDLMGKTGAEFDRAYVDNEVGLHQQVLESLDKTLIPGADNAELKTLLQETRQTVQRHLERARELQNTLRQDNR